MSEREILEYYMSQASQKMKRDSNKGSLVPGYIDRICKVPHPKYLNADLCVLIHDHFYDYINGQFKKFNVMTYQKIQDQVKQESIPINIPPEYDFFRYLSMFTLFN